MPGPRLTFTGVVLDAPDARALADFYRRLLGWETRDDEPYWVTLRPPSGGATISFQTEPAYVRPSWPSGADHQQMMMHLDVEVDDLDAAGAHAVAHGGAHHGTAAGRRRGFACVERVDEVKWKVVPCGDWLLVPVRVERRPHSFVSSTSTRYRKRLTQ